MISRTPVAKSLCSRCRSQFLVDVSRRSAEIRECIVVLQTSPSPSETEYETARQHLLVLAEYERQGILRPSPSSPVMLQRLEALRGESQARMSARRIDRGIRDDRPLVDWVSESDRLKQRFSPRPSRPQGDRRAQPRRRTSCTVVLHPLGVTALAADVSQGGIYLRCRAHRSPGSPVRLVLHTPNGPITAQGLVRRVDRPKHGAAADTNGLAVQFTKTPPGFSPDLLS
jgi:hypothetical protein